MDVLTFLLFSVYDCEKHARMECHNVDYDLETLNGYTCPYVARTCFISWARMVYGDALLIYHCLEVGRGQSGV